MNVAAVKLVCWTFSTAITLGLSAFVYDFYQHRDTRLAEVPEEHVRDVLSKGGAELPQSAVDRMDRELVKRAMEQLNWTGMPPPDEPEVVEDVPTKPPVEPIEQILSIVMLQVSRWAPEESRLYARFLKAPAGGRTELLLKNGDKLPDPYAYVQVKEIRSDGVDFAFDDAERPIETLKPATETPLIFQTGPDGPRVMARESLPTSDRGPFRPKETTLWRKDYYILGTDDGAYLAENYPKVLTNDVRYKTWIDPQTGRRAGIEIQEVREGSIAARHGAMTGDVILSINGHKVTSDQDAIQFVRTNKDKYSVWEVEILRYGRTTTLTYTSPSD